MPPETFVTVSFRQRDLLLAIITTTADYMARWNVYPSEEADAWITQAIKTVGYYERVMHGLVLDLYKDRISVPDFESAMLQLISNQYRRAYYEGLKQMGLSRMDMTVEMETQLQNAIANELNYLRGLIDDILAGRLNESGLQSFYLRVEMWSNRYNDIRSQALVAAGKITGRLLKWQRGPTSDSCSDCMGYDGQVKTAGEWDEIFRITGHRPGAHALECKGFRCLCGLEPVD